MRTLAEIKGEESIIVFGEILPDMIEILSDKDVRAVMEERKDGKPWSMIALEASHIICTRKFGNVYRIMRTISGEGDDFECNIVTIPAMLIAFFNDPAIMDFFTSQAAAVGLKQSSGNATENTPDGETTPDGSSVTAPQK